LALGGADRGVAARALVERTDLRALLVCFRAGGFDLAAAVFRAVAPAFARLARVAFAGLRFEAVLRADFAAPLGAAFFLVAPARLRPALLPAPAVRPARAALRLAMT
jgi:hypothetical protein